jgi:hypothetical protein
VDETTDPFGGGVNGGGLTLRKPLLR